MTELIYVTTNETKFKHAAFMVAPAGITLVQRPMDMQEIQSNDGEAITRHKAQQAYEKFKQPLVVNDDTWSVPGLDGFPGAYMKQVNEWFTPKNWLDLTRDLDDRRIILHQNVVYQDEHGQHYFVRDIEGQLLPAARGQHKLTHLTVMSFKDDGLSSAEHIARNEPEIDPSTPTGWHLFTDWFTQQA